METFTDDFMTGHLPAERAITQITSAKPPETAFAGDDWPIDRLVGRA
jgi:hypothetical protein